MTLYRHLCRDAAHAVAEEPSGAPVTIDAARHALVDRGIQVSLASRAVLRRLLYAFLAAGDH
jgi:hypothetical protein